MEDVILYFEGGADFDNKLARIIDKKSRVA
jgi:hypothetical protein